ncbi:MAG: ATP-binding protein [Mycobacteriales bacterium]
MPGETAPEISTPDRRVRVFVSSTLEELADERRAVRTAVTRLRLTPVMFELGARPHPPRELYRAYLAQSDVFVGVYWRRYGWVAPGESVSGLEDEYVLSGDRPKLIYVKSAADREPRLTDLLRRVQADDRAAYKPFEGPDELGDLVADDLAVLLTERFTRPVRVAPQGLRSARLPVPPTAIVGREAEVGALGALLADPETRLVTLVGPGGIGKTRLALEVAAEIVQQPGGGGFDGVWFVDLAPVTDAAQVPAALAGALGIRPEGTGPLLDLLADRLQGRRVLLVLDNFEQVLGAAPAVATLLAACPEVTVLVTSRTVLRLRGEREVPLASLAIPAAGAPAAVVADAAAVRLFVARAREVRPDFELTEQNAVAVAELCCRLDGIPLALELAAAQLRMLTPAVLLRRLGDRLDRPLDLAAGPVDLPRRQRTLRATVEWSHSLLNPAERALLARLSVFTRAWTLDGAEAVGAVRAAAGDGAAGDIDVLETLSGLVAQSLVSTDQRAAGEPRFRMLDTVRAYARERLAERGEREATLRRLADYLCAFAAAAGPRLTGPDNREWTARVDDELDDLRSMTRWAVSADDAQTAVRITAPLFTYWWSRGLLPLQSEAAERVAALPSASRLPPDAAAWLLWARGMFRIARGDLAGAEPLLRRLVDVTAGIGDVRLRAHALAGLGLATSSAATEEARGLLDEAVAAFRRIGDRWGLAFALSTRGQVALQHGDPAAAAALHREGLAAAEGIGNDFLRAQALDLLGLDAMAAGDLAEARSRFAAAAEVHGEQLDQEGSAYCLGGFAAVAFAKGRAEPAARLIGAAKHAREVVGAAVWPGMRPLVEAMDAAVQSALGDAAYAAALTEGAAMRLPDALRYAREATE